MGLHGYNCINSCLFLDIRWIASKTYSTDNGILVYDTGNTHVVRIHTDDGYVIGKSLNSNCDFHAAYKGVIHSNTTNHQHEIRTRIFFMVMRAEFLIQPLSLGKMQSTLQMNPTIKMMFKTSCSVWERHHYSTHMKNLIFLGTIHSWQVLKW